jgi:hypothetical protein
LSGAAGDNSRSKELPEELKIAEEVTPSLVAVHTSYQSKQKSLGFIRVCDIEICELKRRCLAIQKFMDTNVCEEFI